MWTLKLWNADLRVPFDYAGDALFHEQLIKTVVERPWVWTNPNLGAPGGFQLYDFPVVANDSAHLLAIKLLSIFSRDWALLCNMYFLLGFPLTTWTAMAVFRRFGVGFGPAIVGAVLYAFLPARLLKGENHLFLDVFYQVPLAMMVVLWVTGDAPPLFEAPASGRWPRVALRRSRSWGSLLVCALTASTGAYYAFFTAILLLAGGVWGSSVRRSIRNAASGLTLAAALVVCMCINGIPYIVYQWRHGHNPVADRVWWESETFGLKIIQLLLPADGHPINALRTLKQRYDSSTPIIGDSASSLGFVGALGFLLLLGWLVSSEPAQRAGHALRRSLAVLNLFGVLLGTIGGFGAVIALLVTPQIRGYARMSTIVEFFALFAVVLVLDGLSCRRPFVARGVLPVVLVLGLLDQATPAAVRPYAARKREYGSDADLVRRIEASVPAATEVFELPFVGFPEVPPVHRITGYDPVRPYLHSRELRWSYPTMRGRPGDAWARGIAERLPHQMVDGLVDVGFGGILVDRDGYADEGVGIQKALADILGSEPLGSVDGRFAFFSLLSHRPREELERARGAGELDRYLSLHPIVVTWDHGCYYVEHRENDDTYRWCKAIGEIGFENDTPLHRNVAIQMRVAAANSPAKLTLDGDLFSTHLELGGSVHFAREFDLPPGYHPIRFFCDGRAADAPPDPRTLVWLVDGFVLAESPSVEQRRH
ncbi:MAG TPA: hypothetical protein VNZ26_25650 [Vicinamibacterales bacterium]|nr:hypothetical protein [Vicinamibacterales bacterium]